VAVEDRAMVEECHGNLRSGDDLGIEVAGSDPADDVWCVGQRGHSPIL
jgi:hypothetical protein